MLPEDAKIIGLTGPIGSGKNQAAKVLRRRGAYVIDADKTAHTLYMPQSPVWGELVKAFGSKILFRGGKINRKKLGEIVFSDKQKLQELDRIVHPYLKEAIVKEVESCMSSVVSCKFIVINAAVLKEIGLIDYVDEVWTVAASEEKRVERLLRSGLSEEEARRRIASQASQEEYLEVADVVIKNEGTVDELNAEVQAHLQV